MAPTYAPSHARYAISCTPIPSWSTSKSCNTPSTNQLHVFSFHMGRSVLLNKDYCLNTFSKIFRQSGNAWNLLDFGNQSAACFCVDTIKYYSIPSVPSRLEGVKTRPQSYVPILRIDLGLALPPMGILHIFKVKCFENKTKNHRLAVRSKLSSHIYMT